jgi:hypothetical protein
MAMNEALMAGELPLVISHGHKGDSQESLLLQVAIDEEGMFLKLPLEIVTGLGLPVIGKRLFITPDNTIESIDYVAPVKLEMQGAVAYAGALVTGDMPSIGMLQAMDLMAALAPVPSVLNIADYEEEDEGVAEFLAQLSKGFSAEKGKKPAPVSYSAAGKKPSKKR